VDKCKFLVGGGGTYGKKRHGQEAREAHHLFARRANEFTTIREFKTTGECVAALRQEGRTIWQGFADIAIARHVNGRQLINATRV
jgi:hypothetical protein